MAVCEWSGSTLFSKYLLCEVVEVDQDDFMVWQHVTFMDPLSEAIEIEGDLVVSKLVKYKKDQSRKGGKHFCNCKSMHTTWLHNLPGCRTAVAMPCILSIVRKR